MRIKWTFWGAVGVLLLVAAGLILRLRTLSLDNDEIWNIWQTFGTPQQIIYWTSPSEYPTYMLILGAWKELAGLHPYILHYLTILLSLPAVAFMYRAVRRIGGEWAGILAALAISALPISMFTSLQARSYVLVYTALPLALWMSSRYLDRPTFKRGLLLGISIYIMYLGNVSIIPAMGLFALYVLLVYRKRIVYGLFPGILALVLILPDYIANKSHLISGFTGNIPIYKIAPLPQAWFDFFNFFTLTPVWYGLAVAASLTILYVLSRSTPEWKKLVRLWFWLGWFILIPLILYILEPHLHFYTPRRYGWWYVFGLSLLVGLGLAYLPRHGRWAVTGVLVLMILTPFNIQTFNYIVTPLGDNMSWLRDHIQANDALMVGQNITCNWPEEWDYYTRLYFPQGGLRYVTTPEGTQRLWYVSATDPAAREVEQELAKTRMPGRFVGPPGCLFRLYEGAPDPTGILFENGMRFHGFQIMNGDKPLNFPLVFHDSEPIRVRLWWSVDQPVPLDYSISLNFRRQRGAITQSDNAPQVFYPEGAPGETSQWMPDQLYVEERTLPLPASDYRHPYNLMLDVYWYGEPDRRFSAPGVTADNSLLLTTVDFVAW